MEADSLSDGFLERPLSMMEALIPIAAPTEPRLRPGEVLCDRFEVIRFLARGGMGEVYEAYDTLLREQAALKIIRPELASNPVAIEQFKQEVSRARSVRSDHVCQIFEAVPAHRRRRERCF